MSITKVTWKVNADGDWSDASDWSTGKLPDSKDAVTISTKSVHTITYDTGNTTVDSLTVGAKDHFVLSGGSLDVLTTAKFGDGFTQTGGSLEAKTVNVSGNGALTGGDIIGKTHMTISGNVALANYTIAAAAVLTNDATTNQTGNITIGSNTGVNAELVNGAKGTYSIAGDYGIVAGASSASLHNSGTFEKSSGSGTSSIAVNMISSGTLTATHGDLQFTGATNTISGTLNGKGEISFADGVTALDSSAVTVGTLGLYNAATIDLGANLSYDAHLDDHSNGSTTINVGKYTLALGADSDSTILGAYGQADLTGTGQFTNAGTLSWGYVTLGQKIAVTNTGTIMQTADVTAGDGSGKVPAITNAASGTYNITSDSDISENGAIVSFSNKGLLEKTGSSGTSTIGLAVTNSGAINARTGTLAFDNSLANTGTIEGKGTFAVTQSGVLSLDKGSVLSVANFDLNDASTMNVDTALTYKGVFDNHSNGSTTIDLSANLTLTGADNTILGSYGMAYIDGTAELVNTGTLALGYSTIEGTASIDNQGTINQTQNVQIGGTDGKTSAIVNATGATYAMNAAVTLSDGAATTSHFDNSGTFSVSVGTGTAIIDTTFNNLSGATIHVASGTLQSEGVLLNNGTVSGTDFQVTQNGQFVLEAGTSLAVHEFDLDDAGTLTLDINYTDNKIFHDTSYGSTTIDLGAHTLTLTGASEFSSSFGNAYIAGTGTLDIKHASNFSGGLIEVSDTATLAINAAVTASGELQIGDTSGEAASVVIGSSGSYDITTDGAADIGHGASDASTLTNNGLFEKTAGTGTTVISTDFVNNGTITVTSGKVEFIAGTLSGDGTINGTISYDGSGDEIITAPGVHGGPNQPSSDLSADSFNFSTPSAHSAADASAAAELASNPAWFEHDTHDFEMPATSDVFALAAEHHIALPVFEHPPGGAEFFL
jgi:hypothetical protein